MSRVNEKNLRNLFEEQSKKQLSGRSKNEVRGEFCILVAGSTEEPAPEEQWWESLSVYDHIEYYINEKKYEFKKKRLKQSLKIEICRKEMYIKSIIVDKK